MTTIAADLEPKTTDAPVAAADDGAAPAREALRYLVASICALALDAGLLWAGTAYLPMAAWVVGAFSYFGGLVLIYLLSIHWVFTRRTLRDERGEFMAFAALGLVGLVLNSTTLWIATGVGIALPIAKALSAGIGFVANFVSRKVLLFSGRRA